MSVRTIAVNYTVNPGPLVAGNRVAAASMGQVAAAQQTVTAGSAKVAGGFRQMATGAGLLNPAILGPAGAVLALKKAGAAAAEFEHEFANVTKTVDGTPAQLDAVARSIQQLSLEMPTTTTELNAIASAAGQLGVQVDQIAEFTRVMAMAGTATNMLPDEAAMQFARFSNITQTPIDQVESLVSTVVALGNNFAAQEDEIVNFAMRIAGAGSQVGMANDQIFALSTALPAMGLRAEMGGTAVSRILVEIANAVDEGSEKLDEFARVSGMSSEQFAAAWRDDAAGAFLVFLEGLQRVGAQGESTFAIIDELGLANIRTQDTLLRGASASEEYARALGVAGEEIETVTALQEEFDNKAQTTVSQLQQLNNNITEMFRQTGEAGNDLLNNLLPSINNALARSNRAWSMLDDAGISRWQLLTMFVMNPQRALGGARRGVAEHLERTQEIAQATEADLHLLTLRHEAVGRAAADAATGVDRSGQAAYDAAGGYRDMVLGLDDYLDALKRVTDPVYNLEAALRDVEEATDDVAAAEKKFGTRSTEYEQAVVAKARALDDLEAAALNGDLAFDEYAERLERWVEKGRLTRGEADLMIGRVAELIEQSNEFTGDYEAQYRAEIDQERFATAHRLLNELAQDRTATIRIRTTGGSYAIPQLQGGTVRINHAGGLAGTGPTRAFGPLAADEVPVVAQRGEWIINRQASARHHDLLAAINAGVFHDGGVVGGRSSAVIGGDLGRLTSAIEQLRATIDRDSARERRSDLTGRVSDAERDVRQAKTAKERAAANERLAEARKAVARYDRDAARQAELAALQDEQARLQAELRAAEEREALELRIRDNRREYLLSSMTVEERLGHLGRRIAAERAFTDEWMDLVRRRQQITQQEADTAKRAADDALATLNRMLDDRRRILDQIADLEDRHYRERTAAVDQYHRDRQAAIDARRDSLLGGLSIDAAGFQAGVLVNTIRGQVDALDEWAAGLDELRARGVSQDVIDQLGLAEGPEALGRIRSLLAGTEQELADLNDAIGDRMARIGRQVAREAESTAFDLGRRLATMHHDHLNQLREMDAAHLAQVQALQAELAQVGADSGRTYVEAIAEGIASGIPALVAQVARVQQLMRDAKAAEAAANVSAPTTIAGQAAALRASLGLPADPVSDAKWERWITEGSRTRADMDRRLREAAGVKVFDTGLAAGPLRPGEMGINLSGANEWVLTGRQLQAVASGAGAAVPRVNVVVELDGQVVGRVAAPVVAGEVRVRTGRLA